ncbi:hypothetical protein VK70_16450 [Paenibacillus durus ATCC 35681]|uniref:Uncharacterized protein n=1 Tax=Paenibacillus durus ATCC 35681 TaxID=1333534 RepID=A0A0F7CJ87_PAEDU|nr:hypothetical protein VK70_16450 [Paenibacillus durus ATCC 35681]
MKLFFNIIYKIKKIIFKIRIRQNLMRCKSRFFEKTNDRFPAVHRQTVVISFALNYGLMFF